MEAQRQAQIAAENAEDDAKCKNFGAVSGTSDYLQCRVLLDAQRKNINLAHDAMIAQNSAAMMNASAALLSQRR